MLWFKKKKPLSLPAQEANVIAQLQLVRVKFEREQKLLENILFQAKRGVFQTHAVNRFTSQYSVEWIINKDDIDFLKSLGYQIETNEKVYKEQYRDTSGFYKSNEIPYLAYTIKW